MKKEHIIIFAVIGAILFLNVAIKPFFVKREAFSAVENVLELWEQGDLARAMQYWKDKEKSPPIYDLSSYEIIEKNFERIDGNPTAEVVVVLNFPAGNLTPSGKEWLFKVALTSSGMKIVSFTLAENY